MHLTSCSHIECCCAADTVSQKLRNNNVFTIAKRNVEGQDMLYQSVKLTNAIWVLAELKIQPGNTNFMVSRLQSPHSSVKTDSI